MKIIFGLICLQAVDIYLLVLIGGFSGWLVLGIILGTAALAIWLVKTKGLNILENMKKDLLRGVPPADRAFDGLFIMVGGLLLLLPGVISDLLGLLLMIPGNRRLIKKWSRAYLARRFNSGLFYADRKWQDVDVTAESRPVEAELIDCERN